MIAINDCIFMESAIYQLIRKYFSDHQCYTEMLHLVLEVSSTMKFD